MDILIKIEEIDLLKDQKFQSFIKKEKIILQDVIAELEKEGIIYCEDNKIKLLTDELLIVSLNGKIYAGENRSGEMINYFEKQM